MIHEHCLKKKKKKKKVPRGTAVTEKSLAVKFKRSAQKKVQKNAYLSGHNKRSFEHFCVWVLFQNASSHSVPDFFCEF